MTPKRESLMLPAVRKYFKSQYEQHTMELPFYEHRIDLYGYSAQRDSTVAVELKLRNWRRALEQALVYQLCSDYVFIAVPATTAKRVDLEELRSHGIGLLAVSGRVCVEELPAVLSPVLNSNYKAAYTAIVKE
jgi:hypothetical protein